MNQFRLNPEKVALWSGGIWQEARMPKQIAGFCFDARTVKPDECFVALSCGQRDGHEFVQQALDNGAGSLLLERSQAVELPQLMVSDSLTAMGAIASEVRGQFSGPVIGITGSCGKTSTKEMLRLLCGNEKTHATPGNWNNLIGVPMTLFGLNDDLHEFAIIEAGINQPGEMSALGSMIQANLTIVTNIGPAHLELLGSLENVAAEKSFLTAHSEVDAPVLMPADVAKYSAFLDYMNRAIILAEVGEVLDVEPMHIVRYDLEVSGAGLSKLSLRDGDTVQRFEIASPSRGMCVNAALAIVAARYSGIPDADIKERLLKWLPTSNRGCIRKYGKQTFYIDCYNANPSSMVDAFAAFSRSAPSKKPRCYVVGTMNELGENSADMHRETAAKIELCSGDKLFFVGPEALTRAFTKGAIEKGADPSQIESVENVDMIKSAVSSFSGNIFLKGSRSHQLEKILPKEVV